MGRISSAARGGGAELVSENTRKYENGVIAVIENLDVKKMLFESGHLPTMPAVANQLLSIRDWENIELKTIAEIVAKDVSLSSKILRVANSPFYGFGQRIGTVSQAIVALGLRSTRSLCLSFSLLKAFPNDDRAWFDCHAFWTRSLNTAVAARELALIAGSRTEEEAFLAGLLQDIGVMVMGQSIPDVYLPVIREAKNKGACLIQNERERLGTDHVEVVKLLFDHWNMPASLYVPVLYHHAPEKAYNADEQTLISIRIQHLASCIGDWLYTADFDRDAFEQLNEAAEANLNISSKELEALLYRIDTRMNEISELFEFNVSRPNTYANLLEKVNLTLGDIVDEQERLLRELEAAKLEAHKLTEQLRMANIQLLNEARTDSLTNLANRKRFDEFLQQELNRSFRYHRPISLLFIDLDNLKSVNDRYGHLEGGAVLTQIGDILRHKVRASDMVARYGGDEFIIALVETDRPEAAATAERIRRSVEETSFYISDRKQKTYLTVSVGVTTWQPFSKPVTIEILVKEADSAMYRAKNDGKNCVVLAEDRRESFGQIALDFHEQVSGAGEFRIPPSQKNRRISAQDGT